MDYFFFNINSYDIEETTWKSKLEAILELAVY